VGRALPPGERGLLAVGGLNEETRATPASFDMRPAPFPGGYFTGDSEGLGFASSDGDAAGPASDVFVSYFSQLPGGDPSSAFSSPLAP
jgi:hypothetical protein